MKSKASVFDPVGVGVQNSDVRVTNQRVILTKISHYRGASAADLSRHSKLAPQTVASILQDLDELGLVRTGDPIRGRRGQPARPYFVNPQGAYAVGLEVGWRHIEAVLVNLGGELLAQYHRDYLYPDPSTIVQELAGIARGLVARLPEGERAKLLDFGIASPTDIGRNVHRLGAPPGTGQQWHQLDLRTQVERLLGAHVSIFNDGSAGCWAELGALPRPRPSNVAYILIGTAVGAGIVANSVLWQGPGGNSANIGSMLVTDRSGKQEFVHLLASILGLEKRLGLAGITVPQTTPMYWPWSDWEDHVREWIEDASRALAKALLNTAAIIEFQLVVVDAVTPVEITERLVVGIRNAMAELPTITVDPPNIARGHWGGSAPSIGAAYLPLFNRFFSRELETREVA